MDEIETPTEINHLYVSFIISFAKKNQYNKLASLDIALQESNHFRGFDPSQGFFFLNFFLLMGYLM